MLFLCSVIDVLSFTSLIPIIYLINDPGPISTNPVLSFLYKSFHFTGTNYFILGLLVCMAFLFVFKNLILLAWTHYQNKFIFKVALRLTDRQLNSFYSSSYLSLKNGSSTTYLRYLITAPQEFAVNILAPLLSVLFESFVVVLIGIAVLIYFPVILLLIFFTVVPVSYFLISTLKKKLNVISDYKGKLETQTYHVAFESVSGFSDVKLFNKEDVFIGDIKRNASKLYDVNTELNVYLWIPRRIIETLVILFICILFAILSVYFEVLPERLVLILATFATAAYRLMPSVNDILSNIVRIKSSQFILDQLSFFSDQPEKEYYAPLSFNDKMEFNDIRFGYGEHMQTLNKLSITLNKGEFIVITGDSGAGKTTIGKILTGFIRPDSGTYLIDGAEVKHFDQLKHLFGYVTQDFYLFDKSLLENIAVGEEAGQIDMEKIRAVIEASNLTDFVNELPDGIHYKGGEMGARLSGGQKQRVAIARALYKKASVLVLDEITSALDIDNEVDILNSIYEISKRENLTVILITHRVSSLRHYDKLYELDNAKLSVRQ